MIFEAKVHRLARYRKLDALEWGFSPIGDVFLRRWKAGLPYAANAIAREDLPAGVVVEIEASDGVAEVRQKK